MRNLTIITAGVLFGCNVLAQSELPSFAEDASKIKVKLDMPLEGRKYKNGTGYSANVKTIKKPKKVALVSIYTFDPGFTKVWKSTSTTSGYYYDTKTTTTHIKKRNSKGNAGPIANSFYAQSLGVLKEQFKDMDIDLLEPEEFLDTPEKTTFYNNFKINRSKLNDFLSKALNSGVGHDAIYAYPEGYNVISIDNEPFANYTRNGAIGPMKYKKEVSDGQLWVMSKIGKEITSINELTEKLGVDAVVFMYSTIYTPKETEIVLQNVNMLMFGKNSVPLPEGKTSKFNYFPGQMYLGLRANVGVPIYKEKKKDPSTNKIDTTGYDNIILAMMNRMKEYFTW